jgi:hypothetical protein
MKEGHEGVTSSCPSFIEGGLSSGVQRHHDGPFERTA